MSNGGLKMAVIKCSNCKNEILDTEIVCPYCDCPISETIRQMKNDDLESYSKGSIDGLTGKIPVIKYDEEPKLATSSDFKKEKAAILKDLDLGSTLNQDIKEDADNAKSKQDPNIEKTVKISRESISSGETRKIPAGTAVMEKISEDVEEEVAQEKKSDKSKYVILGITVVVILLVVYIIYGIVNSISGKLSGKKKVNKIVEVTSDATLIEKDMGYKFHSGTLTISDDKVMKDYTSSIETPWYEHIADIKYVTIKNDVTKIGSHAFEGFDKIEELTISGSLETIGDYAFKGCDSLEKIVIPDKNNLSEIGDGAFEDCERLKSITGYTKDADLEPTLEKIGSRAFANCSNLEAMKLPMYTEIGDNAFKGVHDDFVIICESSGEVYNWAKENNIPTKTSFDASLTTNEPNNTTTEKPAQKPTEKPTEKPNTPNNESTKPTEQPSTSSPQQSGATLQQLMSQLQNATTQAEKDKILAEIDKITR